MENFKDKFRENLLRIKAIAFDIDGVMTDGGVLAMPAGKLYRVYDAKDSFALRMASMNGFYLATITGGTDLSIRDRMLMCGVEYENIFMGSRIKIDDFRRFCKKYKLKQDEVMYFGDDIPDIETIKSCGLGICPSDADPEVKQASDYVSKYEGGKGCIRECVSDLLITQGKWVFNEKVYKNQENY